MRVVIFANCISIKRRDEKPFVSSMHVIPFHREALSDDFPLRKILVNFQASFMNSMSYLTNLFLVNFCRIVHNLDRRGSRYDAAAPFVVRTPLIK